MADLGVAREGFLREFLELPHGTPCHDTFSRVFRLLEPQCFQTFFDEFRADLAQERAAQCAIALDGKQMRRSLDRAADESGLNVVAAFAHGARVSLGLIEGAKGGGEMLALRQCIKTLDVKGVMITADALHCQRETCQLIVQEGGDHCLQLKADQGDMQRDVRAFMNDRETDHIDEHASTDADHGRIEERSCHVCIVPQHLDDVHEWPHLKAFVHVTSTRRLNGEPSQCERICLMSRCPTARDAAAIIRGHWQIENNLHWSLDVIMNDDQHRARKDNAPINLAALRRVALNIIRANTEKGSNRVKFKRAGWSNEFLRSLLNNL